jgi:fatty acid-binding protein DegV
MKKYGIVVDSTSYLSEKQVKDYDFLSNVNYE